MQKEIQDPSNKFPMRPTDDFFAWNMEKTEIFIVRIAYNLALKLRKFQNCQASSSAPDGESCGVIYGVEMCLQMIMFCLEASKECTPYKPMQIHKTHCFGCRLPHLQSRGGIELPYHAIVACPHHMQWVMAWLWGSTGICLTKNNLGTLDQTCFSLCSTMF